MYSMHDHIDSHKIAPIETIMHHTNSFIDKKIERNNDNADNVFGFGVGVHGELLYCTILVRVADEVVGKLMCSN